MPSGSTGPPAAATRETAAPLLHALASVILAGTEALLDTGYDPRVSALVTMRPRGLRRVVSGGSRRALFN